MGWQDGKSISNRASSPDRKRRDDEEPPWDEPEPQEGDEVEITEGPYKGMKVLDEGQDQEPAGRPEFSSLEFNTVPGPDRQEPGSNQEMWDEYVGLDRTPRDFMESSAHYIIPEAVDAHMRWLADTKRLIRHDPEDVRAALIRSIEEHWFPTRLHVTETNTGAYRIKMSWWPDQEGALYWNPDENSMQSYGYDGWTVLDENDPEAWEVLTAWYGKEGKELLEPEGEALFEATAELKNGGAWAANEKPFTTAKAWIDLGFTPDQIHAWLEARCFDPNTALALKNADVTPEQATRKTYQGTGTYEDTIGYKASKGDLEVAKAAMLAR